MVASSPFISDSPSFLPNRHSVPIAFAYFSQVFLFCRIPFLFKSPLCPKALSIAVTIILHFSFFPLVSRPLSYKTTDAYNPSSLFPHSSHDSTLNFPTDVPSLLACLLKQVPYLPFSPAVLCLATTSQLFWQFSSVPLFWILLLPLNGQKQVPIPPSPFGTSLPKHNPHN